MIYQMRSIYTVADVYHKAALPNQCAATTAAKPLIGSGPQGLSSSRLKAQSLHPYARKLIT